MTLPQLFAFNIFIFLLNSQNGCITRKCHENDSPVQVVRELADSWH